MPFLRPTLPFSRYQNYFPLTKQRGVNFTTPISAQEQNKWSYNSAPYIRFYDVVSDSSNFSHTPKNKPISLILMLRSRNSSPHVEP